MQQRCGSHSLVKRAHLTLGESRAVKSGKPDAEHLLLRKALDQSCKRAKRWAGSMARRDAMLDEFEDRYTRLMSILCDAAKNGCRPRLETEYEDIRKWLLDRQPGSASVRASAIRLSSGPSASDGVKDPLEQIVRSATLADLLATDSGELIERVSQLSDAVFRYIDGSRIGSPSAKQSVSTHVAIARQIHPSN